MIIVKSKGEISGSHSGEYEDDSLQKAIIFTIMGLRVPLRAGNFLDQLSDHYLLKVFAPRSYLTAVQRLCNTPW
jgi:hypothetical protein